MSNAPLHGLCALMLGLGPAPASFGDESADPRQAWTLSAVYTADLLRNARGGLAVGNAYLDNLDITLEVDGERAFGMPGLTLFAYGLYNNKAARFSEVFPGDAMTASNIEAPQAVRLYEAWADWTFGNSDSSLRFGLYDLNSEFDVSDARSLFINSSFGVGHELGQTGRNGPSIFPVTSLAVRMSIVPVAGWTVLAAAVDGVPGDPDDPTATRIRLGGDDGALLITELQRAGESFTKVAAGVWHYTEKFERIDDAIQEVHMPRKSASSGAYALADLALWRDALHSERRLEALVRIGVATDAVNEYDATAQAGLILRQPFAAQAEESLGLGIVWARTGAPYRRAQAAIGAEIEKGETALEVTYRRVITSWLTVQPDIQFILNPGADRSLRDALVLGLRVEFAGTRSW